LTQLFIRKNSPQFEDILNQPKLQIAIFEDILNQLFDLHLTKANIARYYLTQQSHQVVLARGF